MAIRAVIRFGSCKRVALVLAGYHGNVFIFARQPTNVPDEFDGSHYNDSARKRAPVGTAGQSIASVALELRQRASA